MKKDSVGRMSSQDQEPQIFSEASSPKYKWLDAKQAAEFLKTTPKQIRNLVWQGRLTASKPFGKLLFKRTELERVIETSTQRRQYADQRNDSRQRGAMFSRSSSRKK